MTLRLKSAAFCGRPPPARIAVRQRNGTALGVLAALVVFIAGGVVAWPEAIVMIPGGALGGYSGVWIAKRVPQGVVRAFVIAVGLFLAIYYFVKP